MIPVHGADHEETISELLGDVCEISSLGTHHASVVDQAVL